VIVDCDDMSVEAIDNANANASGGAGIQSAQLVADHDIACVLTGNCGPNAFRTLKEAGIITVVGAKGTVREAIDAYQRGELTTADGPTVTSHTGMGNA
jgi:predicted Fe-Mo cluster-binding NifX family protein